MTKFLRNSAQSWYLGDLIYYSKFQGPGEDGFGEIVSSTLFLLFRLALPDGGCVLLGYFAPGVLELPFPAVSGLLLLGTVPTGMPQFQEGLDIPLPAQLLLQHSQVAVVVGRKCPALGLFLSLHCHSCGAFPVPIPRAGVLPGSSHLHARRHPAPLCCTRAHFQND